MPFQIIFWTILKWMSTFKTRMNALFPSFSLGSTSFQTLLLDQTILSTPLWSMYVQHQTFSLLRKEIRPPPTWKSSFKSESFQERRREEESIIDISLSASQDLALLKYPDAGQTTDAGRTGLVMLFRWRGRLVVVVSLWSHHISRSQQSFDDAFWWCWDPTQHYYAHKIYDLQAFATYHTQEPVCRIHRTTREKQWSR